MQWELDFLNALSNWGVGNPNMSWLSWILSIITNSCEYALIWIVVAIIFLCFKKTRKCGITLAVALLIFALLFNDELIKNFVGRTRPIYSIGGETLLENLQNTNYFFKPGESPILGLFAYPKETSYSFMSGHTYSSFLCSTIIFYHFKKGGIGCFVFALLVAFSRLYFGVHWPTDVLRGMINGVFIGILLILLEREIYPKVEKAYTKHKEKKASLNN